jgi:hypothetical protein
MASAQFPATQSGDAPSVVAALESGRTEWQQGGLREAVRWIHRAADAAESSGDDLRALTLARIAADLIGTLQQPLPIPRDEAAALAPCDDFNDQTIVDSPATAIARQAFPGNLLAAEPREPTPTTPPSQLPKPPATRIATARAALRVCVSQRPGQDGSLQVHVLEDGVEAPNGTIEALLVVLDPEAELPVPSRLGQVTSI